MVGSSAMSFRTASHHVNNAWWLIELSVLPAVIQSVPQKGFRVGLNGAIELVFAESLHTPPHSNNKPSTPPVWDSFPNLSWQYIEGIYYKGSGSPSR